MRVAHILERRGFITCTPEDPNAKDGWWHVNITEAGLRVLRRRGGSNADQEIIPMKLGS